MSCNCKSTTCLHNVAIAIRPCGLHLVLPLKRRRYYCCLISPVRLGGCTYKSVLRYILQAVGMYVSVESAGSKVKAGVGLLDFNPCAQALFYWKIWWRPNGILTMFVRVQSVWSSSASSDSRHYHAETVRRPRHSITGSVSDCAGSAGISFLV